MNHNNPDLSNDPFSDNKTQPRSRCSEMYIHDVWGRPTHVEKLRLKYRGEVPPFLRLSPEEDRELTRLWHELNP